MEVKGILEKIRQQKETPSESFAALEIGFNRARAALWQVEGGGAKILAIGSWEKWQTEEELISAVDISLSAATQKIVGLEIPESKKIVLGLIPTWLAESKITPPRVELLKKLGKELDFQLSGFVTTSEAIVFLLKQQEGIPPTAILAYLEKEKILTTLVNLGKIEGSEEVARSSNLGADLIEGLARMKEGNAFPARILIYGEEAELQSAKDELTNYPWQEKEAAFLHLPKVEILGLDFSLEAVVNAGGRELGAATLSVLAKPTEKPVEEKETMGFVENEDIQEKQEKTEELPVLPPQPITKKLTLPKINFAFLKKLPRFKKLSWSKMPKVGLIIGLILFIVLGLAFGFFWIFPKAKVILVAKSQLLEKDFTLKVSPSAKEIDKLELILPATAVALNLDGEKTIQTTGTKMIGDPSKGKITIYNRTSTEKTFAAGVEVVGPNNLKFRLDEKVIVASESAGSDYTMIPGKATASLTAVNIGAEGNLASGGEFLLATYSKSDFVGKNEEAFSGGTSREIQAVSEKDQQKLLADLQTELKERVGNEISNNLAEGRKIINESLAFEIMEKKYSKAPGEEANDLSLNLKLKFSALSYSETEFRELVSDQIQASIPEGFEYRPGAEDIAFKFDKVTKEGVALFSAHFKAKLVAKINVEEIRKNLVGKKPLIGQAYLGGLPQIDSFEIVINPKSPEKLITFPRRLNNINIQVREE